MKETVLQIAKHIRLIEGSSVIIHHWGDKRQADILGIFEQALENRGFRTVAVQMSVEDIHMQISNDEFLPEKVYAKVSNWKNVMNIIDLCDVSPTSIAGILDENDRGDFVTFMRTVFSVFANDDKNFIQLRLPSMANAEEAGLSLDTYKHYWQALIDIDYDYLQVLCKDTIKNLKAYSQFKVVTQDQNYSYELSFKTDGRQWHEDDGNGDFPAGEVYIAPLEQAAHGSFLASRVVWDGNTFVNVLLTFKEGMLVDCSVKQMLEDLKNAPGDARMIGEFGIGLNHKLSHLTGYGLFDEKKKGTCHIALGANTMFGGVNETPVHIDFVAAEYQLIKV